MVTNKFKFVDDLPGISKASKHEAFFVELEAHQKAQKPKFRKWCEFKIGSETRVSIPIHWREKFDMSTRTIWEGDKQSFNVYVRLKDEVV